MTPPAPRAAVAQHVIRARANTASHNRVKTTNRVTLVSHAFSPLRVLRVALRLLHPHEC